MAQEVNVQGFAGGVENERTVIADNINLSQISGIIDQELEVNDAVELYLKNVSPSLYGDTWMPEDLDAIQRLYGRIVFQFNNEIKKLYPGVRQWNIDTPFVSFEQADLKFRWRAKSGDNELGDNLINLFEQYRVNISTFTQPVLLDPVIDWDFGNIIIYKYTERGVELITARELQKRGAFERLVAYLGQLTKSNIVGIPTIIWLTAGMVVIPEITKTIREVIPGD